MTNAPQRPTSNTDVINWKAYWSACGQRWRTEPEISEDRQKYLVSLQATAPDMNKGVYPFVGIRLTRADIECLLSNHIHLIDGTKGPIDWHDIEYFTNTDRQDFYPGIDIRGANLSGTKLNRLPLTMLRGGLRPFEWKDLSPDLKERSAVHLEGVDLTETHLEGSLLRGAHLEGAKLYRTFLQKAVLSTAHLEGANLYVAKLQGAYLQGTYLGGRILSEEEFNKVRVWTG